MDNPAQEQPRRSRSQAEVLHLDRVVASQPEIGPTPPDGGYGWLIVVSAVIYNITIPGLLVMYGLIIVKSLRNEDHEDGEILKIWDVDIALVPVIMVVMKLLLESWCRTVVKLFNMPRFMALSGLCLTVAGVLLSSFSTNADDNDHIINVFSGIFAGSGCALTGQQTDVIITHYFRDKLTMAQRLVRMAPSIGNCIIPLLIGFLSTKHTGDVVVMIYGAIIMQNCLFLASYTRPVYIERVIRHTYNMLRDAQEDDDEVVFSNENRANEPTQPNPVATEGPSAQSEDADDHVVFKSKRYAKEIIDPSIQYSENTNRFSSDFSAMPFDTNRFSSDFGSFDVNHFNRSTGYQELENIDREAQNPQPLYRETTVDAPVQNAFAANADMTAGTARRTASMKKTFITIANMLTDIDFYLYTLLHLCTTYSATMLGVVFPPLVWQQIPTLNIWQVAVLVAIAHGVALLFIMMCVALPKSLNEKARLCAVICVVGAAGFYGLTLTSKRPFIVVWGIFASFATASSAILLQPLFNNVSNEFNATTTTATANSCVATFLMIWCVVYNYEYKLCFIVASILQIFTGVVFAIASFRRRR